MPWQILSAGHEPIVGQAELIVGRTIVTGFVYLLTDGRELVRLDVGSARARRVRVVGLEDADNPWGLGAVSAGSLWTLARRDTLAELAATGAVARRVAVARPQLGLFGWRNRLVLQMVADTTPAPALSWAVPGEDGVPLGSLQTRVFPVARAEAWALNLVACGGGTSRALPCWFHTDASIDRLDASGVGHLLRLEGIAQPPIPADPNQAPRPIWDAYISSADDLWVLATVTARERPRAAQRLLRYSPAGLLVAATMLPEPARLILDATSEGCLLLTASGRVAKAVL